MLPALEKEVGKSFTLCYNLINDIRVHETDIAHPQARRQHRICRFQRLTQYIRR